MRFKLISIFVFLTIAQFAFGQSQMYLKEDADNYFKSGRYWDAFFLYRDLAKVSEFQGNVEIDNQIKNSSRAMYLWKKTEDYRAIRKYEIAKQNLSDLIAINPYDPNRGLLPRITLEQASELQRFAFKQTTKEGTADYLSKAVQLYNLAIKEGLRDEMVFSLIKQCENSLEKNSLSNVNQPTSYGINYQKELERTKAVEKGRTVQIIKDNL
jgi:tetratricopeptide (TPR) repeat protein